MAFITYSIVCFLPSLQYSVKLTFSSQKWADPCPDESCHMMIHSVDSSCRSQKLGILSIMQYTDIQLEAVIKIRFCRTKSAVLPKLHAELILYFPSPSQFADITKHSFLSVRFKLCVCVLSSALVPKYRLASKP